MKKAKAMGISIGWALLILVFPVSSGVLSVVLELDKIQTLFLQGAFMVLSLVPPCCLVLRGKWGREDMGIGEFHRGAATLWPVLLIFLPAAVGGFRFSSKEYVLGNLFLYGAVGLAEEVYFRAIIPRHLGRAFSWKGVLVLSSLIFALGHGAGAMGGMGPWETVLTILNAFLFGWMAMEMVIISGNILPAVLTHFFFDFETKIVVLKGAKLLTAELVRGCVIFCVALYLGYVLRKEKMSF